MRTSALDRFSEIGAYYDRLVARYGHDHRACDYGRLESQLAKFEALSTVCALNGKSVLDVGCGFADFSDFLRTKFHGFRYSGLEISPQMVRAARRLHPDLDIRQVNILSQDPGPFDVVMANGIFYLLGKDAWPLMQQLITRMFTIANEAVAFTSLSNLASDKKADEFHADPLAVLGFCQTLTRRLVLRHDYHDRDFTVFLYKDTKKPAA
jgi:cyclopropane fatty-acyl-phospholipid synthase-like methyltransferase